MYCLKCGAELEGASKFCPYCGQLQHEQTDKNNLQNTIPEEYAEEIQPSYEQKSEAAHSILNNTGIHQQKSKTKIGIATGLVTCVLVGIISVAVYCNSDEYKIKSATRMIENSNYIEGVEKIQSIYTPQAITLKKFADIQFAQESMLLGFATDDYGTINTAFYDFYNALMEFENNNEIYYLSTTLQDKFFFYRYAMDFVDNYLQSANGGTDWYSLLNDAQAVMMNMVDVNHSSKTGTNFQLKNLQSRVNTSKAAVNALQSLSFDRTVVQDAKLQQYWSGAHSYDSDGNPYIELSDEFQNIIDTLCDYCSSEITSNERYIKSRLDEWDEDDDLYRTEPNMSYSSYVGHDLEKITSWDNIYNNSSKIVQIMRRDLTYGLLTGNTFNS